MEDKVLTLVKARLGISSFVRDAYLLAIIQGVISELEHALDSLNQSHIMFVVDYSTWRYQSRDESGSLPRHLQYRLHNLLIDSGGSSK